MIACGPGPPSSLGSGQIARALASGANHTCSLLGNDRVKCWGYGAFGSLGIEDDDILHGNSNGDMANLPTVNLGTGRTGKAVLKCWGLNDVGQLGQGDTQNRGDEPGELGVTLAIALE